MGARPDKPYSIHVALTAPDGKPYAGLDWTGDVTWPGQSAWSGEYSHLRVRNNFVTELLEVESTQTGKTRVRISKSKGMAGYSYRAWLETPVPALFIDRLKKSRLYGEKIPIPARWRRCAT